MSSLRVSFLLRLVAVILFGLPLSPHAFAIEIPTNLNRAHLDELVQILGFSTSSKFLSNPHSLGGYSGFEIGFSTEFVNTSDLSRLGAGTEKESTFQYNRISIGKGLYYNTDIFVHFIPFSSSNELSEYGGILKWNFYQAPLLPFSISVLAHMSTIDIQEDFVNETIGWDLMGSISLESFALYFGGGGQKARSRFSSTILDLTDTRIQLNTQNTFNTRSSQSHAFVGMHIEMAAIFLAAQIDRYEQPVYSAKLGVRF